MSAFFHDDALNRFTCAVTGMTPSEHLDTTGMQRFRASLQHLLEKHLTDEEREALKCAYGLGDGSQYTSREIAKIFHYTDRQTEDLLKSALEKFRQQCKGKLCFVLGLLSIE